MVSAAIERERRRLAVQRETLAEGAPLMRRSLAALWRHARDVVAVRPRPYNGVANPAARARRRRRRERDARLRRVVLRSTTAQARRAGIVLPTDGLAVPVLAREGRRQHEARACADRRRQWGLTGFADVVPKMSVPRSRNAR